MEGLLLTGTHKMHGSICGLRPWAKNKATNTKVLVITGGVNKGRKVLWSTVQEGESSNPGRPSNPYSIWYCGLRSGREFLLELCVPWKAHNGLGWASGKHDILLYIDDSRIAGQNPIWVQYKLEARVSIFEKVVLQMNLGKTKEIVFTTGFIWGEQGEAA